MTSHPDGATAFVTVEEALNEGTLVLREDPKNYDEESPSRGHNVLATNVGNAPVYFQIGTGLTGGGQGRGTGYGNVVGGYGGVSGSTEEDPLDGRAFAAMFQPLAAVSSRSAQVEVEVVCFEKGRQIPESMKSGSSEYFSYAGMASPSARKRLIFSSSQGMVDRIISDELKRAGVSSETDAFGDIFENQNVLRTVRHYFVHCNDFLDANARACGMIMVGGDGRILCADVYASPRLFQKMFPELLRSAALEPVGAGRRGRYAREADVAKFLHDMKRAAGWRRRGNDTYKLLSSRLVGEAVLYSAASGTKFVHLEAFPRSDRAYMVR
jgi:hypothetical protein